MNAFKQKSNQRTNGPVNAHLRSAIYTKKHAGILWYNVYSPSAGAHDALRSYFFQNSVNLPILPANFSLQMAVFPIHMHMHRQPMLTLV